MAMIQLEVKKNSNETTGSLIRRFTKKMQSSGVLKKAKNRKYWTRPRSDFVKRKDALNRLNKQKELEKMRKLGKISDVYYKKTH